MKASFFVPGTPVAQGSKNAFVSPKTLKAHVVETSGARLSDWRFLVQAHAGQHRPRDLWDGPIGLTLRFFLARPKSHYGTGRNAGRLKPSAAKFVLRGNLDLDKLARAIGDALTGILYVDDRQIVEEHLYKDWVAGYKDSPGCKIEVVAL